MKRHVIWAAAIAVLCAFAGTAQARLMVEREGKLYHRMTCPLLRELEIEELILVRTHRAAAMHGREPCPVCNPPTADAERKRVLRPFLYLVADLRNRTYHRPSCERAGRIPEDARQALSSHDEAVRLRVRPCKDCSPPSLDELRRDDDEAFEEHRDDRPMPELRVSVERLHSEIVTVPGNVQRVRTGIEVKEGQFLLFRARGRIQSRRAVEPGEPPPVWGPGGGIVDGKRRYCLMARIGDKIHEIGRTRGIRAESSGMLYLGVLDEPEGYETNEGAFQVWVQVLKPLGEPRPIEDPEDADEAKEDDEDERGEGE